MSSDNAFDPMAAERAAATQTKEAKKPMRVITPPAILCFPHVFVPKRGKKPTDPPKYSVCLLFRKNHPGIDLKPLMELVNQAVFRKWGGVRPSGFRSPWRDGDEMAAQYPEFRGHYYFQARATDQPGVRRLARPGDLAEAITNGTVPCCKDDIYAGCIVRASVGAYAYDGEGNVGVSYCLNNLLKIGDGKRLAGGRPAEDEFAGVTDGGASQVYGDVMVAEHSPIISGGVEITPGASPVDDDTPF